MASSPLIEHIIINYRWVFVMFLLPISFLYDIYFYTRSFIVFKLSSAPKRHGDKVRKVQAQVRERLDAGIDKPMCTARPGNLTLNSKLIPHLTIEAKI